MPPGLILISYSPTVPLISTLNTDSDVGEETDMVRSTGILPRETDSGATERGEAELPISTLTPWDNLVMAPTRAPKSMLLAASERSGMTVMGATSTGPRKMGFFSSPDMRADMGLDCWPETWTLRLPSAPVPFTLATMGSFSWSSDPRTIASASTFMVTMVSSGEGWILWDIKVGRAKETQNFSVLAENYLMFDESLLGGGKFQAYT